MMNNIDFISSFLPHTMTIIGVFLDSPYTIDITPYSDEFVGFRNETEEIYKYYNVSAIIPEACADEYPGDETWKCTFAQYRMPFVQNPFLLVASQYDSYQLGYNIGLEPNGTARLQYRIGA